MKKAIGIAVLVCAALAFTAAGTAAPPTTHGPYTVSTTDGGCGGNTWANDSLTRTYQVKKGPADSGGHPTWRVKRIDKGTFSTLAGTSPGNCASNATPHGATVTAGVTGKVNGYEVGVVTGGTYNPSATCDNSCGPTSTFISTFFGPSASYTCLNGGGTCTFSFNYRATHGQHTIYSHWTDKGNQSGETFTGDIATS